MEITSHPIKVYILFIHEVEKIINFLFCRVLTAGDVVEF